jgi:hypothetical protein
MRPAPSGAPRPFRARLHQSAVYSIVVTASDEDDAIAQAEQLLVANGTDGFTCDDYDIAITDAEEVQS